MVYENNLAQLKKINSRLFNAVAKENFPYDDGVVHMQTAKNGELIPVYAQNGKNVFLNSKYYPEEEAKKYMEDMFDLPEKAVLVIFGFANGDFLRTFLKKSLYEDIHCIVYEPCADIFMNILYHVDITDLFMDDRVSWIVHGFNDDMLGICLKTYLNSRNASTSRHMVLPKYADLFSDKLEHMVRVSTDVYNSIKMNNNLETQNGHEICRNSIVNIAYFSGARSEMDFVGKFPKDMTAIVVGAGPSLEKNIHQLKSAKGKSLIIAVDTVIPKMLKHDIEPDMIISMDMIKPLEYFIDKRLKKLPFLVCSQTNCEILKLVDSENLIYVSANHALYAKLFRQAGSNICSVSLGGSVATAAISVLFGWGIKRIIMVGLDLALTNSRLYVGDEEDYEHEFDESQYKYVEGIVEDKVLTRVDYYDFLLTIEEWALMNPDLQLIDATEGGAKKKNTIIMSLKDAVSTYCTKPFDLDMIMKSVPRLFLGDSEKLVKDNLIGMAENLKQYNRQAKSAGDECHRAIHMLNGNDVDTDTIDKINEFMIRFYRQLSGSYEYSFIQQLIQGEANIFADDMHIESSKSMAEIIDIYQKYEKYYISVADAISEIERYIAECMEYIKKY